MKLQFVSRVLDINGFYYEGIILKSCYLLSDYILFHSHLGSFFDLINNMKTHDEEFIFKMSIAYMYEKEEFQEIEEQLLRARNIIKIIKKNKVKSKKELVLIQQWNNVVEQHRQVVIENNMNMTEIFGIKQYIDLFDEKILWGTFLLNNYTHEETEEDPLIKYLYDSLYTSDKKFFLNLMPFIDQFSIKEINHNTITEIKDSNTEFYTIPLFELPENINLNSVQMKSCRTQFLPKLQSIWKDIDTLNNSIKELSCNLDVENTLISFSETISGKLVMAQQTINNNLFIRKSINSGNYNSLFSFEMAVCTTATLIKYFEKEGTLLPFVACSLKELIEKTEDLNSYQLVFYIKLDEPIKFK